MRRHNARGKPTERTKPSGPDERQQDFALVQTVVDCTETAETTQTKNRGKRLLRLVGQTSSTTLSACNDA